MSMTDPIADMFTRIRNAQAAGKRTVAMPASTREAGARQAAEGRGLHRRRRRSPSAEGKPTLEIALKYYEGKPVIERLERISRSGLRVYRGKGELPKILGGLGVSIMSTSAGIMTDAQARKQGLAAKSSASWRKERTHHVPCCQETRSPCPRASSCQVPGRCGHGQGPEGHLER